jgi:hypothetical protein
LRLAIVAAVGGFVGTIEELLGDGAPERIGLEIAQEAVSFAADAAIVFACETGKSGKKLGDAAVDLLEAEVVVAIGHFDHFFTDGNGFGALGDRGFEQFLFFLFDLLPLVHQFSGFGFKFGAAGNELGQGFGDGAAAFFGLDFGLESLVVLAGLIEADDDARSVLDENRRIGGDRIAQ